MPGAFVAGAFVMPPVKRSLIRGSAQLVEACIFALSDGFELGNPTYKENKGF